MNKTDLKELVKQGLQTQRRATQIGDDAAAEIAGDATHTELKAALQKGSNVAKIWDQRLDEALRKMGVDDSTIDNEIAEAHYEVSKHIRADAQTPEVRDLGIIASSQLVMHYYIAGLGTLASYARSLDESDVAELVADLLNEAKSIDEAMTELADRLIKSTLLHTAQGV